VQEHCKTDKDAGALLKNAVDTLGFSARSYGRILKVARTIADLEAAELIDATHVSEAIQYRNLDRYKNL
jgi:magnesium chelatase family protein